LTAARLEGRVAPSKEAVRLWTPAINIPFLCYVGFAENLTSMCQVQGRQKPVNSRLSFEDVGPGTIGNRGGGLVSKFSNIMLKHIHLMQEEYPGGMAYFT
jgi:hypothetical protein